jgi:putative salt-induced outer membrane protein YdiY
MRAGRPIAVAVVIAWFPLAIGVARAQGNAPDTTPRGAPPPDATALVVAPTAPGATPVLDKPNDGTTAAVSAGGQLSTGNSRLLAGTVNGSVESRHGANGVAVSALGNYGQGAPPGSPVVETAENYQLRLRYDRYVIEQASVFMMATGRHDRFQGLDFRLNLDPGFKYLFTTKATNLLWAEAGYDFQFDNRRTEALGELDAMGNPVLDMNGNQITLPKTQVDHSTRVFLGFRHAFNKEVTLAAGLEYLQSVLALTNYDSRINFDALFAAKVGGGLSLGLGFSARYDRYPLPGKADTDTATTVTLIYAYSDIPEPPPPPCPCPNPPAAPPAATPAAPSTTTPDVTPAPTP